MRNSVSPSCFTVGVALVDDGAVRPARTDGGEADDVEVGEQPQERGPEGVESDRHTTRHG